MKQPLQTAVSVLLCCVHLWFFLIVLLFITRFHVDLPLFADAFPQPLAFHCLTVAHFCWRGSVTMEIANKTISGGSGDRRSVWFLFFFVVVYLPLQWWTQEPQYFPSIRACLETWPSQPRHLNSSPFGPVSVPELALTLGPTSIPRSSSENTSKAPAAQTYNIRGLTELVIL